MWIRKRTLILLVLSALAVGSVVSVGAQEGGGGDRPPATDRPPTSDAKKDRPQRDKGELVREEKVVKTEQGIRTIAHDLGIVQSVSGRTLTLQEADGTTPAFRVPQDARISRDGERAELADLQPGDHAKVMRLDEGAGLIVRGIHAQSAERQAQMDEKREWCEANPQECRRAKQQAGQKKRQHERMQKACEANPERCEEAKRRMAERKQEFCEQNPEKCAADKPKRDAA